MTYQEQLEISHKILETCIDTHNSGGDMKIAHKLYLTLDLLGNGCEFNKFCDFIARAAKRRNEEAKRHESYNESIASFG